MHLPPHDDNAWEPWRNHWQWRSDTTYLNHGSFGLPPDCVRAARRHWREQLDEQPMDFFVRQYEPAWFAAREALAKFVGACPNDMIFVENATDGMNIVADSISLLPGDEVLLTDHEYGAVMRIWQRKCEEAGTHPPVIAELPLPMQTVEEVVDAIFAKVTPRTRFIVASHITSPTAVILPVAEICRRAKQLGIAVCVDGAHAPAQVPLDISRLDCDFYTATCHKWLCAPFGCAFLYVAPNWQSCIRTPSLSWGRLSPGKLEHWYDEFIWSGTRDPSAYFSVPTAIDFINSMGADTFRVRSHWLAEYARQQLLEITATTPLFPDSKTWYGSMALVPLPGSTNSIEFQKRLWQEYGIEVLVPNWKGRPLLRVSCHAYTRTSELDRLADAVRKILM